MSENSAALSQKESRLAGVTVAQKYTNIPLLPSLGVSLAGGAATLALAHALSAAWPYFHDLILMRGPVQYLTIFAFWFTLGMLGGKYLRFRKERAAFDLPFIKEFTGGQEVLGTKTFIGEQEAISENLKEQQRNLILVNRINKAIKQIRINKNPADVANVLKTVAETDSAVVDSSYVLIKFMVWAIPVLGFIGTIMGMTQAIGSFDSILKDISQVGFAGIKQSLGDVTGGLSLAFETTFLALVLSAFTNLLANGLLKREEDLLSDVEEFTTDNIINKYSAIKERVSTSMEEGSLAASQAAGEISGGDLVRELKNLNRQNQANADNMMAQLGALIEAVRESTQAIQKAAASPQAQEADDSAQTLGQMRELMEKQNQLLAELAKQAQSNSESAKALDQLPATLETLNETSRKLGELFGNIYNRTFA